MSYQDIHIDDISIRDKYISDMESGKYSDAKTDLQNSQLSGKVFNATMLNGITSKLIELQNNSVDPSFKSDKIKVSTTPPELQNGQIYFKIV